MHPEIRSPLGVEGSIQPPESPSASLLDDGAALVIKIVGGEKSVEIPDPVRFAWMLEKHASEHADKPNATDLTIAALYGAFEACGVLVNGKNACEGNLNLTQSLAVRNRVIAEVARMGKG